jgi:hypothetical protein
MDIERPLSEVVKDYRAGRMSRRAFIVRLMAAGLSTSAIGMLLASSGVAARSAPSGARGGRRFNQEGGPWAADPASLTGTVKIYKGPFSPMELELQQPFIESYNANFAPNVTAEFSMYDWTQAEALMTASLAKRRPRRALHPGSLLRQVPLARGAGGGPDALG